MKKENNFDLSVLDAKFKEAEEALINKNLEVEVKVNDYVIVEDLNNEIVNNPSIENTNTSTEENIINEKNTNSKEETKENNISNEEEMIGNQDTTTKSEGFNWLKLLWLLPLLLIIIFIIIFIKRKKDEE